MTAILITFFALSGVAAWLCAGLYLMVEGREVTPIYELERRIFGEPEPQYSYSVIGIPLEVAKCPSKGLTYLLSEHECGHMGGLAMDRRAYDESHAKRHGFQKVPAVSNVNGEIVKFWDWYRPAAARHKEFASIYGAPLSNPMTDQQFCDSFKKGSK